MKTNSPVFEQLKDRFRAEDPAFDLGVAQAHRYHDNAQEVYDLREAAGLTEEQLAEKAGVTADDIEAIEHFGWEEGTFDKLVKILAVFGKQAEVHITDPIREPAAA